MDGADKLLEAHRLKKKKLTAPPLADPFQWWFGNLCAKSTWDPTALTSLLKQSSGERTNNGLTRASLKFAKALSFRLQTFCLYLFLKSDL